MKNKNKTGIFGTDGIRSKYGTYPLDEQSIKRLGFAIGSILKGSKILIGRDTRQSGINIIELLSLGLSKFNDIKTCGIIPTPVLSFLVEKENFDYGIMITASHNPYYDNGIKLFKHDGEKCEENILTKIEDKFFNNDSENFDITVNTNENNTLGILDVFDKYSLYIESIINKENLLLKKKSKQLKLIIDCANGAYYKEAEKVFSRLDVDLKLINNEPDGKNINENCGAMHTEFLAKKVKNEGADLGIAFDGDGDRLICVDKNGFLLNGDYIILLIARYLKEKNNDDSPVIGTTMANLGFEKALNKIGISLIRTDVGDKYVYKEMKTTDALLGGEQSGHIIMKGYKTGDGLLAALYFISAINYFNLKIDEIFKEIDVFPQIIKSYPVNNKIPIENWEDMRKEIDRFNEKNKDNSRLVIRYSGTEPKIRVMIESESKDIIEENIKIFEDIILKKGQGERGKGQGEELFL